MIVIKITDGLGNQLFQYAYALYLSITEKSPVYLDCHDVNHAKSLSGKSIYFGILDERTFELDNYNIKIPKVDSKYYKRFIDDSILQKYLNDFQISHNILLLENDIQRPGFKFSRFHNYYIEGNFFSNKYNAAVRSMLLDEIQLKNGITLDKDINDLLLKENTVSIHVRRGDFLRVGRDITGNDYYSKAINYIVNKVDNPYFLVFSDDIEWVKSNMKLPKKTAFISGRQYEGFEELYIMSLCKHNIIANSTYSYWGAWLNQNSNKIVVCPRGWRNKVILKEWIKV